MCGCDWGWEEEEEFLSTTRKVKWISQNFYLLSLLGQIQHSAIGRSSYRPHVYWVPRTFRNINYRINPTLTCPLPRHPSQCCSSCLSTTWCRGPLLTRTPFRLLTTVRWRKITAPTSSTVVPFGASFGAALLPSFCVLGSRFIRTFRARRSGIHCYHLPSIAFHCSFGLWLCLSTCWHGQSDSA